MDKIFQEEKDAVSENQEPSIKVLKPGINKIRLEEAKLNKDGCGY